LLKRFATAIIIVIQYTLLNYFSASKLAISQGKAPQVTSTGANQTSSAIISLNNTLQQCLEGTAGEE
jgi:hypothetical protein